MNLNDAEQFQRLIVDPAVKAIREQVTPIVSRMEALEARVGKLESIASKAVKIYTSVIAVGTFVLHAALTKVRAKIGV